MKQHKMGKHKGWKRLRRSQADTETARNHSEQEILSLSPSQSNAAGIIRPNMGDVHMPADLAEPGQGQQAPPRVMLVIITLALIFIAIIMYLVSQMPKKD